MLDGSRNHVRPNRPGDIAHHPSRPAGPLPPNPRQKRDAGLAKPAPRPGGRRGDLLSPGARDVRQPPPQAPIMEPGSGVEATGERRCLIVHRVNDQYSTKSDAGRRAGLDCFRGRSHGEPEVQAWAKEVAAPAARIRCLPAIPTEAQGCCGTCSIRPAFETDLPRGDAAPAVRARHTGWGGFASRSSSTSSAPQSAVERARDRRSGSRGSGRYIHPPRQSSSR